MITQEDRDRYPHHTDGAILGIKVVKALTTDELKRILDDPKALEVVRSAIGNCTNPTWVKARAAEELCFVRRAIDEVEFDRMAL